ncbi:MAG: cytochrome c oxidase subunit 3 [Acidimicrobiia bacterium]|jgi:heme/copper-type cytochrome/quinol oxidase subunit 3|nr:cytochrome c oxidase subunit 3 [Acidimicrobiia bacterium]
MASTVALPPAPLPARPRVLLVGTALAAAAGFMGIVGLVGIYLSARSSAVATGGTWLPDGTNIPLTPANMAFATMLLSGVTLWWAVDAVGKNDRQMAYLALGLTIFFGIAVVNATSFLYTQSGLPVRSTPGVLVYTVTGAHLAMIIIGLVYAAVMTFRTLGGEYHGRDREGLTAAALFWYVTIAAHAVIWLAVYVTK